MDSVALAKLASIGEALQVPDGELSFAAVQAAADQKMQGQAGIRLTLLGRLEVAYSAIIKAAKLRESPNAVSEMPSWASMVETFDTSPNQEAFVQSYEMLAEQAKQAVAAMRNREVPSEQHKC